MPFRLVSTTRFHCSSGKSSSGAAAAPTPALLNSRSTRPQALTVAANSASTEAGSVTSVGTASARPAAPASATTSSSGSLAAAGDGHAPAVAQQRQRRRLADARCRRP